MKTTEDQPRAIIDTIPVLAWSADLDGSADFFNQRWLDFAGLSVQEARGWGWTAAVHADELNRLTKYWQSIVAAGEPGEIEARLRRADGEYRWFLFRASPFRDESGNIVKWYGTNTDIEDRKRAEDALRVSERSSRLIVDSIPGLVCTMSASGELELVNRRVLKYFGKTFEELRDWAMSDAVHPADLPGVIAAWTRSLETGERYEIEHRIRRADGEYLWFQTRGLPVRAADNRILGWHILLTNIAERKRAEALLAAEKQTLEMLANGASVATILESLCETIDAQAPNIISAVMLMDADHVGPHIMVVTPHPDDLQGFTRGGWNGTYIIHLPGPDQADKWFLVIPVHEADKQ